MKTFEVMAETESVRDDDLLNSNPPNPTLEKAYSEDDFQFVDGHDDIVEDDPIVRRSSRIAEKMQSL